MWWSFARRCYLVILPLLLASAALGTSTLRNDIILAVTSTAVGLVVLVIELRKVARERRRDREAARPV